MSSHRQIPLTCRGHTRPVVNLAFSELCDRGYYLISACKDGRPMLRKGDTGDWIGTFEGHKGAVWGVALNANGSRAASGAADFLAKIWNAETGDEMQSFQHGHIVKSVNFSRDSRLLITGCKEKSISIFDLNKPNAAATKLIGHESAVSNAIFFDNDRKVVSCADDNTLRIWDRISEQQVQRISFCSLPNSLEVARDDSEIVVTYGKTVNFFDTRGLRKTLEVPLPCRVYSASVNKDKTMFVCGGEDFVMYKFDRNAADVKLIDSFKGHFGPVHCVKFSPDGELYASGSEDGTLRLWQTTVGKSYGLWRCVEDEEADISPPDSPIGTHNSHY